MDSPVVGQPNFRRKKMTKQLTGKRDDAPLHSAARAGNLAMVMEILTETNEDDLQGLLSRQNQAGETALYVACEYGYVDVVGEMMKHYDASSAGIKAKNGYDPLHVAAKQGDVDILKVLLGAIPELSMTADLSNTTALHTAATQGHVEVVGTPGWPPDGQEGPDGAPHGRQGPEPGGGGGAPTVLPSLVNSVDSKGSTALHVAARKGRPQAVRRLLEMPEMDMKVVNRAGETALDAAEKEGQAEVMAILLEHGAESARALKAANPARELKQTVSEIKHEVQSQLEHTYQTRRRVQGIAKRLNKLHAEGLNNAINSTTVVAVLIATVAFAAIFTVPGEYAGGQNGIPLGAYPGEANIAHNVAFMIFFVFDSISLFISLAVVVVQTSVVVIESKAKKRMMAIINKLMWVACVFISVSFLAICFVVVGPHDRSLAIWVTAIGTAILATTLGTMSYWVIAHRMESRKLSRLRRSSLSRSRSCSISAVSDPELLTNEYKKMYAI
ncbi:unnamed protein product [Spirodela intermedia]|uniref:PGG domain-containing protein n=1 Tax=Spirodela intermedia TaxID=51605 RepID=A0A7I8IBY3_SPIIN|nr:unnamed protein product [Spirodela intermedia]CAA6654864.1 unnamed protein product [Spirodela intermedia]